MEIQIARPDCLEKANSAALIIQRLLTDGGFPRGNFRIIHSILLNLKSKDSNHLVSLLINARDIAAKSPIFSVKPAATMWQAL